MQIKLIWLNNQNISYYPSILLTQTVIIESNQIKIHKIYTIKTPELRGIFI